MFQIETKFREGPRIARTKGGSIEIRALNER
jgi:hypothetical protein